MNRERYDKLFDIILKITKNDERSSDLFHDVLIQLFSNETFNSLSEKNQTYFFIKTVQNQFYSNNSKFERAYKRYQFEELTNREEIIEEEYKEKPTIEWIREKLQEELTNNPTNWYNVKLFELYLEVKRIEELNRRTRIPKYSLRKSLKEMKAWLKHKWNEEHGEL